MADMESRLASMNDLDDFEIEDGDPDPRGWMVRGSDGADIGKVDQLIVDTSAMKVRYMGCDVNDDLLDGVEDRHILIPVGYARLDENDREVEVDEIASADVATLPAYTGLPLTREQEEEVHAVHGATWEEETVAEPTRERTAEEATVTRAEEDVTVGKREVSAGEVDVEKDVETEHVKRPVTTRSEEVEVERRAVSGDASEADFDEEEVRIPVSEEEAVVEKRPEVKEEIVVRKRPVEKTEEVETDVRKERVDVEEHGAVKEEDKMK